MAQGVLVVEAPESSGALNTVRHALEQGRPVLSVPGNIDRPASVGTNNLIKEGATPITETGDILRALNMVVVPARAEHQRMFDLAPSSSDSPEIATANNTISDRQTRVLCFRRFDCAIVCRIRAAALISPATRPADVPVAHAPPH